MTNPFEICYMYWRINNQLPSLHIPVCVSSVVTQAGFKKVILCLDGFSDEAHQRQEFVRKFFPEVKEVISPREFFDDEGYKTFLSLSGKFQTVNRADFFRIYALYKFGGFYIDTDIIVLKSFSDLNITDSYIAAEDDKHVNNCLMYAQKGHPVFRYLYENFLLRYQPDTFNLVGPPWLSEFKEELNVDSEIAHHFLIPWQEWNKIFEVSNLTVEEMLKTSYSIHLWNSAMSRSKFLVTPVFIKEQPNTLFSRVVKYLSARGSKVCQELVE